MNSYGNLRGKRSSVLKKVMSEGLSRQMTAARSPKKRTGLAFQGELNALWTSAIDFQHPVRYWFHPAMSRMTLFRIAFSMMLSSLIACSTTTPDVTQLRGIANKVHDGDSIHLTPTGQSRIVVRLAGIDAPELQQRFGSDARDYLRSMILNKSVDAHCHKTDRYERLLCVIYQDGADINLAMVSEGLAWHYKKFQNEQTATQRRQYATAEHQARKQRLGLWRDRAPKAPWDYRS